MKKLLLLLFLIIGCQDAPLDSQQFIVEVVDKEQPGLKSFLRCGKSRFCSVSYFDGEFFTFRCSGTTEYSIPELEELIDFMLNFMPPDRISGSLKEGYLKIDFSGIDVQEKLTKVCIKDATGQIVIYAPVTK